MKILSFTFRGEKYQVNESGYIKTENLINFSSTWIFRGGIKHHWCTHLTVNLKQAFESPELLNGCLGADIDHGTYRLWGGQYLGKLPRISNAHVFVID